MREAKIQSRLNPQKKRDLKNIFLKTGNQEIISIKDLKQTGAKIESTLKKELSERLGESELVWIKEQTGLEIKEQQKEDNNIIKIDTNTTSKKLRPHISKWRDAESKCIEIEELFGNTAIDVSIKNMGYDIISTTPTGEKRYIEVKSVKKDYAFSLTNNE